MAQGDGPLNLNRAVCIAAGDAERADERPAVPVEEGRTMMQAIYLNDYVKDLSQIQPSLIPRPTFTSYISSLKAKSRPAPTEPLVHVKVTHTAINHVDLLYAHGVHQNNKSGLSAPPFTLGLEFSGIVLAIHHPSPPQNGDKFPLKPGDKIWGGGMGTHTEELILPLSSIHPLPTPSHTLHDMAALGAGTLPVSYGALTTIASLQPNETILIHAAAGGLGIYAVQIARALGAKVIGTVGSSDKKSIVESLLRDPKTGRIPPGEGVINYTTNTSWEKDVIQICKEVGKDGVDVVYDTVGLVTQSIRCTTFNGRIVVAGFAGRTGTGAQKVKELEMIAVNRILLKQIKLLGYRFGETGRRLPHETIKMWEGLNEMLKVRREGEAVIKPVVYKTYRGLGRVNEAMVALRRREVVGKAVVEVCSEEEAVREVERGLEIDKQGERAKL